MKPFYRDTYAKVSLQTIENNIHIIQEGLPNHVRIMATVKANGYGHGAYEVGCTALKAGAQFLSVAILDEAIALREKGIQAPILILGPVYPKQIAIAAKYQIHLTVPNLAWLKEAVQQPLDSALYLHIKMDTGMHRIGLQNEAELMEAIHLIHKKENFYFTGIFTHFATADEISTHFYEEQLMMFQGYIDLLEKENLVPQWVHCSNSGGTLRFKADMPFNLVRIGILMYGLEPSDEMIPLISKKIRPALSLHSRLTQVKKVKKGGHISYGYTYEAKDDEWIGTIPMGYADGWCRALQGAFVLVEGQPCEIVGRICMDQMMIRLPYEVPLYTPVTLIGEQNGQIVTVGELAKHMKTIHYELLCLLSVRIPRVYDEGYEE